MFEPVGAGGHYLQLGSPHRNVGTSSIDAGLATRLERLTTYAPAVLTGSITQDTVLEPQAWRDVDGPDRGFHYEPLDYAVNALQVQNATLTLTNGVVLVTHSHNAYVSTAGRIGVPQTGDQTLGNLTYYSRDLGRYYQHLASSLRNAGSRQASAAGLAHYTTTWDYAKDTGLVDIGLHYVATANGLPIDTDGDGLPDYVEDANGNLQVDPGETDWIDPDTGGTGISDAAKAAGLTPQTPCLLYSLVDPYTMSVWSGGPDLWRETEILLVEKGTDALRFSVDVTTHQWPPTSYEDYNDELTYRIESPLLDAPLVGSHHLTDLGNSNSGTVLDETWIHCHDKTRETGSYLKVTVTSRNVNFHWPDFDSRVLVHISALRIDFSPILGPAADDRLVFDNQYPTGVLLVPLYAAVRPNEQPAFDYLEGRVKFEVDAVGDSELKWENENGGLGIHDPSSGAFRNLAQFRMLPTSNSAFGPKTARLLVEGLWGLDSEQQFRVFYMAEERNWPGIEPLPPGWEPGDPDARPANYFHYYLQTSVGEIPPTSHGPGWSGGFSFTSTTYPYKYYVGRTPDVAENARIRRPGVNGHEQLRYIDLFAYAARHEYAHHTNLHRFWGTSGHQSQNDGDGDFLPDDKEQYYLVMEAGPYLPGYKDTHGPSSQPIYDPLDNQPNDGERHNCNSWFAVEWPQERQEQSWEWDWARPGKNWPVQ